MHGQWEASCSVCGTQGQTVLRHTSQCANCSAAKPRETSRQLESGEALMRYPSNSRSEIVLVTSASISLPLFHRVTLAESWS